MKMFKPNLFSSLSLSFRPNQENLCKKFKVKEHQKTDFLNLTFVHKNGVERKLDERDVLWSKIDTDTPGMKQVKDWPIIIPTMTAKRIRFNP